MSFGQLQNKRIINAVCYLIYNCVQWSHYFVVLYPSSTDKFKSAFFNKLSKLFLCSLVLCLPPKLEVCTYTVSLSKRKDHCMWSCIRNLHFWPNKGILRIMQQPFRHICQNHLYLVIIIRLSSVSEIVCTRYQIIYFPTCIAVWMWNNVNGKKLGITAAYPKTHSKKTNKSETHCITSTLYKKSNFSMSVVRQHSVKTAKETIE